MSNGNNVIKINVEELKTILEEQETKSDHLVFEEHEITEVKDPLTIFLRSIIYQKKLTIAKFKELVREYYRKIGGSSKQVAQQPNNILRCIRDSKPITSKSFMLVLKILRMEIRKFDAIFLVYNDNNEPVEEHYSIDIIGK